MTATDAELALIDELMEQGRYDAALKCIYQSELPLSTREGLLRDWEKRSGRRIEPAPSPTAGLIDTRYSGTKPYA